MGDEEDQETPFEEMDGHQLAEKTAWVRFFIREASKRGYTIEDIVALLDEPGMTVEAAVQRILSTRKPNLAQYPRLNPILRPGCRTWRKSGAPLSRFPK
jgi:hypothetical protein